MKFLLAIFCYALLTVVLCAGILFAVKGKGFWLLGLSLVAYLIVFARACLPQKHGH
jgi:hypothetical protein